MRLVLLVSQNDLRLVMQEDKKTIQTFDAEVGFEERSTSEWSCWLQYIPDPTQTLFVNGIRLVDLLTSGHKTKEVARQKVVDALKGKALYRHRVRHSDDDEDYVEKVLVVNVPADLR